MILELAKGKIKPGFCYRNQQNLTFFDLFYFLKARSSSFYPDCYCFKEKKIHPLLKSLSICNFRAPRRLSELCSICPEQKIAWLRTATHCSLGTAQLSAFPSNALLKSVGGSRHPATSLGTGLMVSHCNNMLSWQQNEGLATPYTIFPSE